ncbi:MAG TPA: histidine phosphatase family protein [Thermoanaerobaculia bacterium]|nr:histidine phosphatase family protein [Thermoanaerobaculia bacterium]
MPAPRLRLFLARHGQVASNRDLRYVGSRDETLTDLGRRQADALAALLGQLPIELVLSSPLRRALDTAQAIGKAASLEVRVDDRLREQSFGAWEGLSRDEVRARSAEDRALLEAWERSAEVAPPGGESLHSVQRRALDLIEELRSSAPAAAMRWVVLVSHVGPIKSLLASALDLSLDRGGRRVFLDPGTVSVVDWGEPPILRLCNSHAHAGWTSARWMEPAAGSTSELGRV